MVTLLKLLDGPWEKAKGYLRLDLDAIQSSLNAHWSAVFNINNELLPGAIAGDSTIDSVYVSNQGTGHTPLWDKVNLANGVQGRLAFAHLVEATQAAVLIGRRSGSNGDFEQITPGVGVAIHGLSLDVDTARLAGSLPSSRDGADGMDGWPGAPGPQGPPGIGLMGPPGQDGEDGQDRVIMIQAASTAAAAAPNWSVLTNGDAADPELIFVGGDVIMVVGP